MRPLIGITTYVEPATWGVWHDLPTALVPQAYVEAVARSGGRAVLLPRTTWTPTSCGCSTGWSSAAGPT